MLCLSFACWTVTYRSTETQSTYRWLAVPRGFEPLLPIGLHIHTLYRLNHTLASLNVTILKVKCLLFNSDSSYYLLSK